jgi:hypothetical protein
MNFKDLKDLVEKKKAARRALARKQRKQATAPAKLSTKPAVKLSTESEPKVEEVVEETKATEVVETQSVEVVSTGENISTEESVEGATVVEEVPTEKAQKKKSRKKRRTSEVERGVAE